MDVWNNFTSTILLFYVLLSEVEGNVPAPVPEVILSLFVFCFSFIFYFSFPLFSMIISI